MTPLLFSSLERWTLSRESVNTAHTRVRGVSSFTSLFLLVDLNSI